MDTSEFFDFTVLASFTPTTSFFTAPDRLRAPRKSVFKPESYTRTTGRRRSTAPLCNRKNTAPHINKPNKTNANNCIFISHHDYLPI